VEASTLTTPAKGNLCLIGAPVACRRPGSFAVNRRVVIAVNDQPTGTAQGSITQGERMTLPTARTGLRRRCEAVNFDHLLPTLERHPCQNRQELRILPHALDNNSKFTDSSAKSD
jgi:hypothetical protein